jgi:D-hydroxyproline dehydrogenase subunit gamma
MTPAVDAVTVIVNGQPVRVPPGASAAAAVAMAGVSAFRSSVTGAPRGPLCGMGMCFECRATVDGVPNVRTCRTVCREGMEIKTDGA